jgi:hypothetical protein
MLETVPTWIEDTCDKLAQREQFIRFAGIHKAASGADSAHYEFRHSLYRQALYSRLSSPHRSDLQRRLRSGLSAASVAGRWNLAPELAPHFEAGRDSDALFRILTHTS